MYSIYARDLDKLIGHKSYRDGECVALVQETTGIGHTSRWKPGPRVVDLAFLNPGAVIANFVFDKDGVGRFPNKHGYHAALFAEFGGRGVTSGKQMSIWVVDQWVGRRPGRREIMGLGKSFAEGNRFRDCDNADQFYVVVT